MFSKFTSILNKNLRTYEVAAAEGYGMRALTSFKALSALPEGVIITNIDAVVVNFFTRSMVFGGCDEVGILQQNVSHCPASFLSEDVKRSPNVRHALLTHEQIPGYQTCTGKCLSDLWIRMSREFPMVMSDTDSRWVVFDVSS